MIVREPSKTSVGQVRPGQRELHRGLQEAELLAGVVALALELDGIDGPPAPQRAQAVRQLNLAPRVRRGLLENREDIGRQHVAPDDGQVGGRVPRVRLLHEVVHLVDVGPEAARGDDAVAADLVAGHPHHREDRPAVALEHVEELAHARHARHDDVVAQEHAERLVAHERPRAENGVPQTQRLLLADVADRRELGDRLDLRELLVEELDAQGIGDVGRDIGLDLVEQVQIADVARIRL